MEIKESIHVVEQKYKLYESRIGMKNEKAHTGLLRHETCASAHVRIAN